jgi:hypothetical protein
MQCISVTVNRVLEKHVSVFRVEVNQETNIKQTTSRALKMNATCSSETSVDFHQITWSYIPEDRTLRTQILYICSKCFSLL